MSLDNTVLLMSKPRVADDSVAKITPANEASPRAISFPTTTTVSVFSNSGVLENINISELDFLSQDTGAFPGTPLILPATKIVRPPVPLLASYQSIPCNFGPTDESPVMKKAKLIKPKGPSSVREKCRLCGKIEGRMVEIFSPEGVLNKLAEKIATFLPIKVKIQAGRDART
jgi:hypothetical protein